MLVCKWCPNLSNDFSKQKHVALIFDTPINIYIYNQSIPPCWYYLPDIPIPNSRRTSDTVLLPPPTVDPRWATQSASSRRFPGDLLRFTWDKEFFGCWATHGLMIFGACEVQSRLEVEKTQRNQTIEWCWVGSANDQRLPMADSKQDQTEFACCQSLKSLKNVRTEEEINRNLTFTCLTKTQWSIYELHEPFLQEIQVETFRSPPTHEQRLHSTAFSCFSNGQNTNAAPAMCLIPLVHLYYPWPEGNAGINTESPGQMPAKRNIKFTMIDVIIY